MRSRVSILDLGLGNLRSVARAFERAGGEAAIVSGADAVRAADALVVPGQGAFRDAARALDGGLGDAVREHIASGRPYLGLCLGMQVLFDSSDESPGDPGLGLWRGRVVRFADDLRGPDGERLKVPHMGWNVVDGSHAILPPRDWFYFVHSYYCVPEDPSLVVGAADYGARFCAAVARDNVFACQFHPEKSQHAGERVLARFLEVS